MRNVGTTPSPQLHTRDSRAASPPHPAPDTVTEGDGDEEVGFVEGFVANVGLPVLGGIGLLVLALLLALLSALL